MTNTHEVGTDGNAHGVSAAASSATADPTTILLQQLIRDNKQMMEDNKRMMEENKRDRERMEDRLKKLEERSSKKSRSGDSALGDTAGDKARAASPLRKRAATLVSDDSDKDDHHVRFLERREKALNADLTADVGNAGATAVDTTKPGGTQVHFPMVALPNEVEWFLKCVYATDRRLFTKYMTARAATAGGASTIWNAASKDIAKAMDKLATKSFFAGTPWGDLAADLVSNGIPFESTPPVFVRVWPGAGETDTSPTGVFFGPIPGADTDSEADRARRLGLVARAAAARYFTSVRAYTAWVEMLSPAARTAVSQPSSFPAVIFVDPDAVQVSADVLAVFDTDEATWAVGRAPAAPFPAPVLRWLRAFAEDTVNRVPPTIRFLKAALADRSSSGCTAAADRLYCDVVASTLDDVLSTKSLLVRIHKAQLAAGEAKGGALPSGGVPKAQVKSQGGADQQMPAPHGFSGKLFEDPWAWKAEWNRVKREDPEVYAPCTICVRRYAAKLSAAIPLLALPANFAALDNACHWQKNCPSTHARCER